jgi:hypothetical protein
MMSQPFVLSEVEAPFLSSAATRKSDPFDFAQGERGWIARSAF